jgi:hypothetical protein
VKKSIIVLAAVILVLAVSGGAFAAKGLLTGADIANGSLTGADIKKGSLDTALFTSSAKDSLRGVTGARGAQGAAGLVGSDGGVGANGINGINGTKGVDGSKGVDGTNGLAGINGVAGTHGTNGVDGTNGLAGTNGVAGTNGTNGVAGTNGLAGTNGTNGSNGTVTPLSATAGLTALPTAAPPTVVVFLDVPAGKYVILAKTQLAHTGAGDSIDCVLKAGAATVDQISMKTLPALAAVPVSLQAVTTVTSISRLSIECAVQVANGTASYSSLIAMPTS